MENISRRSFAQLAAAFPYVVSRRVFGANDRIRIGVIGVGARSNLLIDQLPPGAEIVAVADCFVTRCNQSAAKRSAKWQIYQDHRQLLEQKDIDGVIVGTHDHGRALCSIHAMQAGKDVYAEKPLTLYVEEGRAMVKAARKYKRIVQVGSQQRSMAANQVACEFIRTGGLGRIETVHCVNYKAPLPIPELSEQAVPEGLNWDVWLGQTKMRPFSKDLLQWHDWTDFSGGQMTNWGAHGLDQVQSALGMDHTGPVEFWPLPDGPKGAIAFRYANGVTVRLELPAARGLLGGGVFVGEKGRIEIVRNEFRTDPVGMIKNAPPAEEVQKWNRAQWQAQYHMQEWLDCMRSRKAPSADVEIGHRSVSVCHLANLTRQLNRRLRWNPKKEKFEGDDQANEVLRRPRRKGYELPVV
jgi:predicted dehydrogenase